MLLLRPRRWVPGLALLVVLAACGGGAGPHPASPRSATGSPRVAEASPPGPGRRAVLSPAVDLATAGRRLTPVLQAALDGAGLRPRIALAPFVDACGVRGVAPGQLQVEYAEQFELAAGQDRAALVDGVRGAWRAQGLRVDETRSKVPGDPPGLSVEQNAFRFAFLTGDIDGPAAQLVAVSPCLPDPLAPAGPPPRPAPAFDAATAQLESVLLETLEAAFSGRPLAPDESRDSLLPCAAPPSARRPFLGFFVTLEDGEGTQASLDRMSGLWAARGLRVTRTGPSSLRATGDGFVFHTAVDADASVASVQGAAPCLSPP